MWSKCASARVQDGFSCLIQELEETVSVIGVSRRAPRMWQIAADGLGDARPCGTSDPFEGVGSPARAEGVAAAKVYAPDVPPRAAEGCHCLLIRGAQLTAHASCPHPRQAGAGLPVKVAPGVRALLRRQRSGTHRRVAGFAADVIGLGGQVTPWIGVRAGYLGRILAAQLVQEPVDSAGLIAATRTMDHPERRVFDQRPRRPPGIQFCGNTLKQIADLGFIVFAFAELDVPDLIPVHRRSQALVLMTRSVTPAVLSWLCSGGFGPTVARELG